MPSPFAPHSTDQPGKELDTFKRRLAILQLLKRRQGRSVRELQKQLDSQGITASERTVQSDLQIIRRCLI
jgi:DeoR/GlpR family transcriptional regulator of sugar metabolism